MRVIAVKKGPFIYPIKVSGLFLVFLILSISVMFLALINTELLRSEFHISEVSPQALYQRSARHVHFGLAYLPDTAPDSWAECLFAFAPIQVFNFLTRPFPWEIFRFNQIFLVINNILLYLVYLTAALGMGKLTLRYPRYSLAIMMFLIFSLVPASLVQGNGFAATRHREQYIFFIYVLAGLGIDLILKMIVQGVKGCKLRWDEKGLGLNVLPVVEEK